MQADLHEKFRERNLWKNSIRLRIPKRGNIANICVNWFHVNLLSSCCLYLSLLTGCLFENELCSPYEICVNGKQALSKYN